MISESPKAPPTSPEIARLHLPFPLCSYAGSWKTNYWLRIIDRSQIAPTLDLGPYLDKSLELVRLLTAIVKTTSRNIGR